MTKSNPVRGRVGAPCAPDPWFAEAPNKWNRESTCGAVFCSVTFQAPSERNGRGIDKRANPQ